MCIEKVNLSEKLALFSEPWSPWIAGELFFAGRSSARLDRVPRRAR